MVYDLFSAAMYFNFHIIEIVFNFFLILFTAHSHLLRWVALQIEWMSEYIYSILWEQELSIRLDSTN